MGLRNMTLIELGNNDPVNDSRLMIQTQEAAFYSNSVLESPLSKPFILNPSEALIHYPRTHAGVMEGWKLAWQVMVRELAPQDRSGSYVRQSYTFQARDIKVGGHPGWWIEG